VGISGFRFHDLRHTGNTLAAATGASTKELMARMGHASPRAALIYQHATRERDEAIAVALDVAIHSAVPIAGADEDTGADGARTLLAERDEEGVKHRNLRLHGAVQPQRDSNPCHLS
jgi:hypothetical protein